MGLALVLGLRFEDRRKRMMERDGADIANVFLLLFLDTHTKR